MQKCLETWQVLILVKQNCTREQMSTKNSVTSLKVGQKTKIPLKQFGQGIDGKFIYTAKLTYV